MCLVIHPQHDRTEKKLTEFSTYTRSQVKEAFFLLQHEFLEEHLSGFVTHNATEQDLAK